jgi:Lon protease-like protein
VHAPGDKPVRFETTGVLAQVREVDADQPGILAVRCQGGQRFTLSGPRQHGNGLWLAEATLVSADETLPVPPEHQRSAQALNSAIASLAERGRTPFAAPYRFDDAGWVANRWCELLPVPVAAKQRLMALDDPLLRLRLVDEYLHSHGVA